MFKIKIEPGLRIRIRIRIHVFLGLLDPDPDPLVRGMDPDPSISFSKNSKKNLDFYCFVSNMQKNFFKISFLLAS
jgi:hypothetical protein